MWITIIKLRMLEQHKSACVCKVLFAMGSGLSVCWHAAQVFSAWTVANAFLGSLVPLLFVFGTCIVKAMLHAATLAEAEVDGNHV